MKRQPTYLEKIFANEISDKTLSRRYEELSKLNNQPNKQIHKSFLSDDGFYTLSGVSIKGVWCIAFLKTI